MSAATATYKCKCCGDPFTARTADRARGWARYCSKSCKAKKQESRTGQHRAFIERQQSRECYGEVDISDMDFGASDGDSQPALF